MLIPSEGSLKGLPIKSTSESLKDVQVTYGQKFHSFLSKYLLCVLGGAQRWQVDLLPVCYWILLVYGLDLQMDFFFALGGGGVWSQSGK